MSRVAVITGVGAGLGAALARKLAREGCHVGLCARSTDYIEGLARELSGSGTRAVAIPMDLTRAEDIQRGLREARARLGPIGILIHHAGRAAWGGLRQISAQQFEEAWRIGPLAGFLCARDVVPDMLTAGTGAILFTGATSSVRGRGDAPAFSSAKFGVRGLAESLARELWPQGIHVAHVVIDGVIGDSDQPATPTEVPSTEPHLRPHDIADAYWGLIAQPPTAWTFEIDVRPQGEEFYV